MIEAQSTARAEARRGRGGRPTQAESERRHVGLLKTAAELFFSRGFEATSIDAIAQKAGVAKRFIYARYADKSELFIAAIARTIQDRAGPLLDFELPDEPAETGLLKFAHCMINIALAPEALSIFRMVLNEAPRFPNLAKLDTERNRHKGLRAIERVLRFYEQRGEVVVDDGDVQAELFFTLTVRPAQFRALVLGPEPNPAQQEARLRAAVRLFLDGSRPQKRD
jgi:TetR/AcrR family transcriptional regulator, mexJK operon transcriptional repressor